MATFFTALPPTPPLSCYFCLKPATQRPDWEDGKGPSSPAVGSAQPAAEACWDLSKWPKNTPQKPKTQTTPALTKGHVRGARLPRSRAPRSSIALSRGSSRAAPSQPRRHFQGKGEKNPSARFSEMGDGKKKKEGRLSCLPLKPGHPFRRGWRGAWSPGGEPPKGPLRGAEARGAPGGGSSAQPGSAWDRAALEGTPRRRGWGAPSRRCRGGDAGRSGALPAASSLRPFCAGD